MLPYISVIIVSNISGFIADGMIHKCKLSTGLTRKIMQSIGFLGAALFYFLIRFFNNVIVATIFIVVGLGIGQTVRSGYWVNSIDIAPKYAGVIMGISNTFATLPGLEI